MHRREEFLAAGESFPGQGEIRIGQEVRASDHHQKILELLRAVGGGDEVAILGRLY